eukprot:g25051.t1
MFGSIWLLMFQLLILWRPLVLVDLAPRITGTEQENEVEKYISYDGMAEQTRWAEWPNSAPMSYGLMLYRLACTGELQEAWENC